MPCCVPFVSDSDDSSKGSVMRGIHVVGEGSLWESRIVCGGIDRVVEI